MPKNETIPVTDDASCACTSFYDVRFFYGANPPTQMIFNSPLPTKMIGSPAVSTPYILIPNLLDGQTYNYTVIRICLNGTFSSTISGTFNT